jgi:hypothetical protein
MADKTSVSDGKVRVEPGKPGDDEGPAQEPKIWKPQMRDPPKPQPAPVYSPKHSSSPNTPKNPLEYIAGEYLYRNNRACGIKEGEPFTVYSLNDGTPVYGLFCGGYFPLDKAKEITDVYEQKMIEIRRLRKKMGREYADGLEESTKKELGEHFLNGKSLDSQAGGVFVGISQIKRKLRLVSGKVSRFNYHITSGIEENKTPAEDTKVDLILKNQYLNSDKKGSADNVPDNGEDSSLVLNDDMQHIESVEFEELDFTVQSGAIDPAELGLAEIDEDSRKKSKP